MNQDIKEDCHICGVTYRSSESVFSDVCAECADELSFPEQAVSEDPIT